MGELKAWEPSPNMTFINPLFTKECKNNLPHRPAANTWPLHQEFPMFPEYRDLISRLKTEDAHFARLFQRHNELDHQIKNIEDGIVSGQGVTVENLKKEKLQLKDMMYVVLRKAAAPA
jgi:uncharacterized protein YdcH (DUF465 family)